MKPAFAALPRDEAANREAWHLWRRFLGVDVSVGFLGNLLTTLMTCLLAYALLFPEARRHVRSHRELPPGCWG